EIWSRVAHVLLPKDYVRFRLTGERAIDAAEASGTLLFDVARRRWSDEMCSALEIPVEWLPAAHESTAIGGAGAQQAGAPGGGALAGGDGGPHLPAVPAGRAHAARRSVRARVVHRPFPPPRPWRARARSPGGRGIRPARLARAAPRPRRRAHGGPRLGRRRAQ